LSYSTSDGGFLGGKDINMRTLLLFMNSAIFIIWVIGQQTIEAETTQSNVFTLLQDADVARFAFGTPTSVTRAGFVKVTSKDIFTAEKGYGFQSAKGLLEYDHGGSAIVLPNDEYTASVYGASRSTSDITCALVEGTEDSAFIVALPDGEYSVWLIASDAAWAPPLFEVWANGEKKLNVRIPRARFVFMEPFQACATDGHLRIDFKGPHGWILNGLLVGRDGPVLAETVSKLERDIFFLTEPELPNWHEVKSSLANSPLTLTPAEQRRGYVVFPVDYTEQILPTYNPPRRVIGKPLTAFATPGEYEPASFCIYTQKDLGHVTVELSDFAAEKTNRTIAEENVEVGIVRCWPQRVSGWGGRGEYHVVPEMIEPPSERASRMRANQLKQWWLTVYVPPDTPAGRYRMSLTVRPEKGPTTALEWRLLVLPFHLSRPADKHWGTWLDSFPPVGSLRGPERRGRKTPAEVKRLAQADMADYRAHGFDLALLNYYFGVKENTDGSFTYGLSTLPQDMEYLKQLGSNAPVVICFEYTCRNLEYGLAAPKDKHIPGTFSPKARKAIVGLVQHIRDEAKRRNWPKIYFFPIDEPGNNKTENRYQFAENVLDFVHEIPGCQTAVTVTSGCVRRLGDRVDVRIYAYGYYNRDKVLQEAKQGHPFWYYENGMFYGHSTLASRGHTGFEFLRSGAEVATAWGFAATQANPHNDFDGGHKDWNVIFPGVDGPTPTIYWELCREGVDDCRYVATLQQHIRQAKERGAIEVAQQAQRVLEPLLAADAPEINNPRVFSRYRWRIAREILALQGNRERSLPFAAVAAKPPSPIKLGPNLIKNPSFEEPSNSDDTPRGSYHLGYPTMKEKPVGALRVTDEVAYSGRYSLKWDLSKVADPEYKGRNPRWLTVNVGFSNDMVKRLQGKRVRFGYWMRLGSGTTVPGLGLRQYLKEQPGEGFYYRGGVEDPAVWNHFVTEGWLSADLESMDIHTWCAIPEAELAKECFFYMDDFSLEVIEEPSLTVTTPLDEYYVSETIPWTVSATSTSDEIRISLLTGDRLVNEQTHTAAAGSLRGTFESRGLKPGIYTLEAMTDITPQERQTARRQIILAPHPWEH
jgi:glycosyl hydrolase family 123